jgi:hypothetical protein
MSAVSGPASVDNSGPDDKHSVVTRSSPGNYRPYYNAFNAVLAFASILMLVYGLLGLGPRSGHSRMGWFAIDLMVQGISIKIASDLIPNGIAVRGQNAMDAGVGAMLVAALVLVLMGDISGLSNPGLWYLIDGAQLALFLTVVVKYLVGVVA